MKKLFKLIMGLVIVGIVISLVISGKTPGQILVIVLSIVVGAEMIMDIIDGLWQNHQGDD